MPYDSQGKPAHSFGKAKLQDEMHKGLQHQEKAVTPKSRPEGHQPDPDGEMKDQSPEDIRDVVNEHGPATEAHMKFDHESGVHQVTTKHGEMEHHSKHGSHHEAMKHMHAALGMPEHEKGEDPSYESGEESKMTGTIPGMGG